MRYCPCPNSVRRTHLIQNPTTGDYIQVCATHNSLHKDGIAFNVKEYICTPLTPIVWVKCCRKWPIVPGWPVRRCGICGTVPVEPADEPED